MKTYVFRVVVEADEDRWSAYCPALEKYGAATWGNTRKEALKHIREIVEMVLEELVEENHPIPEEPEEVSAQPEPAPEGKNLNAVALGQRGGKAKAAKLLPEQRREIAKKAAQGQWTKSS